MKQRIDFEKRDGKYVIKLYDNDSPQYILEKKLEPDLTDMLIGITSTGDVRLKEIEFPDTIYNESVVRQTAERIQKRFEEEGCRSCIALAEIRNTKKTFILPTLNDLIDNLPKPELPKIPGVDEIGGKEE